MKVSGFTFIRNGSLLGYPFVESIKSALPVVDEFVVNVGYGEDDTLERIQTINDPKIKIVQSTWNENMTDRGYVYGQQKMIAHFNCTGDWAFYLEGDELIHESEHAQLRRCLEDNLGRPDVEAIVFDYYHFLAADTLGMSPDYYRSEARIIRNTIRSYHPDGLFFLVLDKNKKGRYPRAVHSGAHIYHYGHARPVKKINEKNRRVGRYWKAEHEEFTGHRVDPQAIGRFTGDHPQAIQQWLATEAQLHYQPPVDFVPTRKERRYRLEMQLERLLNIDFSKKHFKIIN